jgi:hypothetical protein
VACRPTCWGETPQPNGTILRQAREFTNRPFRRFGPVFDLEPDGNGGAPARTPRAGAAGRCGNNQRAKDNQSKRTSAEGTATMSEPLPALCLIAVPRAISR